MLRVWMAISAVWVTFWLALAILVLSAVDTRSPFTEEFASYALIVIIPPLSLLAFGMLGRLVFELSGRFRR
jgi:hypothetical protein